MMFMSSACQTRLAQAIEEVLAVARIPVPCGANPGAVEIVRRRRFAILTQLTMPFLDERIQAGPPGHTEIVMRLQLRSAVTG